MAIRAAFTHGRRRRRRRSADDDPQGLAHPAAAAELRGADPERRGRHRRDARELVRRLLPGAEPTSCRTWRSTRRAGCGCIPSSSCPRIRRRRGSPIAPARSSASTRRSKFNWKVGDRVPLISPIYRKPDGSPWEFTIDGIYDSPVKGTDKTQFFFHWDYINETFRDTRRSANQVGWYVIRVADPATAGSAREADRHDVRELAGRNEDRDREGVRRRTSPSRSATSARS